MTYRILETDKSLGHALRRTRSVLVAWASQVGRTIIVHRRVGRSAIESQAGMVGRRDARIAPKLIGQGGCLEHIREHLANSEVESLMMKANTMYWMTDRTPHEAVLAP